MVMLPITIRKRNINKDDVKFIQASVNEHWEKGRTQISKILCQKWNWIQRNGNLKDMACREILVTLERKNLISLPPGLHNGRNQERNRSIPFIEIDQTPIKAELKDLNHIRIVLVRNTHLELLYNSLVQCHHYLGYKQIVGNHLKYMAFIDDRPVACIGWGSPAWAVKSRDAFIRWDKATKARNLQGIVNNTRFLILPWITVKCLASKILAINVKRIAHDWNNIYHYPIYLSETFIEKNRFRGTCYKAANWIHVGQTKGTSKKGNDHLFHGNVKDVYLYPLWKDFRSELMR